MFDVHADAVVMVLSIALWRWENFGRKGMT